MLLLGEPLAHHFDFGLYGEAEQIARESIAAVRHRHYMRERKRATVNPARSRPLNAPDENAKWIHDTVAAIKARARRSPQPSPAR